MDCTAIAVPLLKVVRQGVICCKVQLYYVPFCNNARVQYAYGNKKTMLSRGNCALPLYILTDTESAGTLLQQYELQWGF